MPIWSELLDEWLSTHHGVISHSTLLRLGVAPRTIDRMVARSQFITMMPGVYRSRQAPPSREQLMTAACQRNPYAMIAFMTAGSLWRLRKNTSPLVHVLVPHGCSPQLPGIVTHRCRRIDAVDIVERPDGIRLTSPPRTLFDSADMLGIAGARSVLEQILHEKMCTLGTVIDTYLRLGRPGRPGTATMGAMLASRPAWRSALQSDLESRVLDEIERQGLPTVTTQCPVRLLDGITIHVDFGWPEWKVGLEVDHPAWHDGLDDRRRDAHRDRRAAGAGWAIGRVLEIDAQLGLAEAIRDVADIIAVRRQAA
ncbi:MAG: type IV toxin-antitoxin system AbiEi family antitoxin domain-containing protein [Actinomycetota bacterium]